MLQEHCQARLMTCIKLILAFKSATSHDEDVTSKMKTINEICESVTHVVNNSLNNGTIVATIIHKPLHTHVMRAKVRVFHNFSNAQKVDKVFSSLMTL